MRVLGLVVEYNPFHSGHLYHLEESRRVCQPDLTIAVMSGNFTQRGEPALIDKWARAEMAAKCGVDIVFELPTAWALRSARDFAYGGVLHLEAAGVTDICFGSENGNLEQLLSMADELARETPEFKQAMREQLATGAAYPRARYEALQKIASPTSETLRSPNDILGVSYLLALQRLNSKIKPHTIKRIGAGYHDKELQVLASATAIRNALWAEKAAPRELPVPAATKEVLQRELLAGRTLMGLESLSTLIKYAIRSSSPQALSQLPDMEQGLAYRVKQCEERTHTAVELIDCLKTKRYTWTRLQRILCYALLNITNDQLQAIHKQSPQYLRLLAMRKEAGGRLKKLQTSVPVVTRAVDFKENLSMALDIHSTNIYALGYSSTCERIAAQDLLRHPVVVE